MNKVHNGTPQHGESSLCVNCIYATIVSGLAWSSERVFCSAITGPNGGDAIMSQPVIKCNKQRKRTDPSLQAMTDIAWSLRTSHSGKTIGFVSPKDARWQKTDVIKDKE